MEIQSIKHLNVLFKALIKNQKSLESENEIMSEILTEMPDQTHLFQMVKVNTEEIELIKELKEAIKHELHK